jgi:transposase-like protein
MGSRCERAIVGWSWSRIQRLVAEDREYRNGYYERDFVTRLGTIWLRIARTRNKNNAK